jgi:hypothetical protein
VYHQSLQRQKITETTKRNAVIVVAVAAAFKKSGSKTVNAAHSTKALAAADFEAEKVRIFIPGYVSVMG